MNRSSPRRFPVVIAGAAILVVAGCNLGAPRQTLDVAATAVAVGDLDGDGVADLVASSPGAVAVHLADGAGGFSTTSYPLDDIVAWEFNYDRVEVLDADADGDLDVVLNWIFLDAGSASVVVLPNDGVGVLGSPRYTAGVVGLPRGLAVGEANGDGRSDVAAVSDHEAVVAYGAAGGLGTSVAVPDSGGTSLDLADVDGDGRDDLVVGGSISGGSSSYTAGISVFLATASGFSSPTTFVTDPAVPVAHALRVDDVDGDGVGDVIAANGLAVASWSPGSVSILLGHGDGTFGPAEVLPDVPVVEPDAGLATGDIDVDGATDVLLAHSGGIRVLFGDGTGALIDTHVLDPTDGAGRDVEVLDVDGDGVDDVVSAGSRLDLFLNRLDGARDHD